MDVFAHFADEIERAVKALQAAGDLDGNAALDGVNVEPPRDASHGDLATNAAMVLAKAVKQNPRELAQKLADKLAQAAHVESVEVAGPGFINIRLEAEIWAGVVREVLDNGADYGRSEVGAGEAVNIEYVSANPTGPLHVGHCRGAVFGDALASLLEHTGHEVSREYYINDAGAQVDILARSAYLRYREAMGEAIGEIPEGLYPGDYLVPVGKALAEQFGDTLLDAPEAEWIGPVRAAAIAAMMAQIKDDLDALNIHHDVFYSEASLAAEEGDQVAATIADDRRPARQRSGL